MDLSQRTDFCHWLLHFIENLIWVQEPLINVDLMYQLPKYTYSYFW